MSTAVTPAGAAAVGPLRSLKYGFVLALMSPIVLALAPALYRLRLAGLTALILIPIAVVLALVALVLSIVAIVAARRRGLPRGRAVAGLVVACAVLSFPVFVVVGGSGSAPIHDVTTDTEDPPQFVDVLPIRERSGALNPVEYEGARVAALQKQSFPDLQPMRLDLPPSAAFARALAAANAMNWELVSADAAAGRVEATDTTALFGFKDDVVIRVRQDGQGSRIDVRSLSRVGGGDLGTNAKRIRAYLQRLANAAA